MITEAVVTLPISTISSKCIDITLLISADENEVHAISVEKEKKATIINRSYPEIINRTKSQLQEYFLRKRQAFDLPINTTQGTDFQRRVWAALRDIPYGETKTYGEIAKIVGCPKGARAVGMACNKNPLLILTPCHRVIGSSGALTGFACGLDIKEILLEIEKIN